MTADPVIIKFKDFCITGGITLSNFPGAVDDFTQYLWTDNARNWPLSEPTVSPAYCQTDANYRLV